jgi:uncharacterized membrane protein
VARIATYRKFVVAALVVVAQVASLNVAHGTVQNVLVIVLAAAGALGVYAVPNAHAGDDAHPSA